MHYKIMMSDEGLIPIGLFDYEEADYDQTKWLCDVKFYTRSDAQYVIDGIYKFLGRHVMAGGNR